MKIRVKYLVVKLSATRFGRERGLLRVIERASKRTCEGEEKEMARGRKKKKRGGVTVRS